MQNILITGAAGFIGSTLARYFHTKKDVRLTLIDSLEFGNIENLPTDLSKDLIITNCLDIEQLRIIIPSNCTIFHFAGISSLPECESNYISSINNNFLSTINVFELGVEKNMKKIIFASTSAIYENNKKYPFKEEDETYPDLMYSYSKKLCENYLEFRSKKLDSPEIIITRFFNVFGYKQNIFRKNPPLTGYLLDCVNNKREAIIYNNNPEVKRDYIYIDDLIFILNLLLENSITNKFNIFNLTSGNQYSVEEIIRSVEKVSRQFLKHRFEVPTAIWSKYPSILKILSEERISEEVFKTSIGDNSKLLSILPTGYKFKTMEEGLNMMLKLENDL
jgi:nucleoside-diphosphate-sugar epimerase